MREVAVRKYAEVYVYMCVGVHTCWCQITLDVPLHCVLPGSFETGSHIELRLGWQLGAPQMDPSVSTHENTGVTGEYVPTSLAFMFKRRPQTCAASLLTPVSSPNPEKFFDFCLFWDRILLYSPGWPWNSDSASYVVGVWVEHGTLVH